MHIVYLVHDFPERGLSTGGAGNYVANIAQIMQKNGHKVQVVTESKEQTVILWRGIEIHYIRAAKGFKDTGKHMPTYKKVLKNLWRSYWYNKTVAEINKNEKVDIVQSVNTYGISLFRVKRIPYIVRLSSYPSLWAAAEKDAFNFDEGIKLRRVDEKIHMRAIKKADTVISPSYLIANIVKEKIDKRVKVIESPVLMPEDKELGLQESMLVSDQYFVTYGALANRKSIKVLASIIDKVLEKYKDMKYVIIGRDRLVSDHGKYVMASKILDSSIVCNKERFFFMGEISDRNRLFAIVKNAHLCILPTRIDNLPNTVLESMALGKIVISSDKTSVEQLILDGHNGFLAEIDSAEGLFQKIDYVMQLSDEEKRKIESRAKDRVKDLTPEKVYTKMMNVYVETITDYRQKN